MGDKILQLEIAGSVEGLRGADRVRSGTSPGVPQTLDLASGKHAV
jgi:hypothetical protein